MLSNSVVKLSNYEFSLVIILIDENPLQTSKFTNIKYDIVSQESDLWIIMAACVVNDYSLSSLSNAPSNHRIICSQTRESTTEIIAPKHSFSHEMIVAVSIVAEAHKGKQPK